MISIDRIARDACQSAKFGDRRTLASGIGAIASLEKSERFAEACCGFRSAVWMYCGHDV